MKLTEHFDSLEFSCKDGTKVPDILMDNLRLLCRNLEVLRGTIREPIIIMSGYRTPGYNKKCGGKPASKHMEALAADIIVKKYKPFFIFDTIESLIKEGKMSEGGLELYEPTEERCGFVHYDARGTRARW